MQHAKDIVDILQGMVTIGAVFVGGIWTYLAFVRKRLRYPRAELAVAVNSTCVAPGFRLVHVAVEITNTGSVLLAPEYAEIRLRQVIPLPAEIESRLKPGTDPVVADEKELRWPLIVGREWEWNASGIEIEPGESDRLNADFVINDTVEVVQIYTFVRNPRKRHAPGWGTTLMHTLTDIQGDANMADREERPNELTHNQQRQQEQQKVQQQQQQQLEQQKAQQQQQQQ